MRLMRNIIGVLTTAAVILSALVFGVPVEASAGTHAEMAHAQAAARSQVTVSGAVLHDDQAHNHAGEDDGHSPAMTGHSDHGPCNTMACCPVVSLGITGPERLQDALPVSHWPDLSLPLIQAAPERAEKPPKSA